MEAIHTVLTWLVVWVASSVVLSPLLGMWIRNRSKYSFEYPPRQSPHDSTKRR
jgi:hypothetical protein